MESKRYLYGTKKEKRMCEFDFFISSRNYIYASYNSGRMKITSRIVEIRNLQSVFAPDGIDAVAKK